VTSQALNLILEYALRLIPKHFVTENIENDTADYAYDACHEDKDPFDAWVVVCLLAWIKPLPVEDKPKDKKAAA
jgi:hypothetical protein